MEISKNAYNVMSLLASGAFTLHDMRASLISCEQIPEDEVDAYMLRGLAESASHGWITWEYESDYGNASSTRPAKCDPSSFVADWVKCAPRGKITPGIPDKDNPTMLIEATSEAMRTIDTVKVIGT